jgi:hypothetical protein
LEGGPISCLGEMLRQENWEVVVCAIAPHVQVMEADMVSTCTMVIKMVGQLARGITFSYKLQLMNDVFHWKGIDVYNL